MAGLIILIFGALSAGSLLLGWIWNITMPELFGLRQITVYQAMRLLVIGFLLFGVWRLI